jgi:carboxypeptidase family protein/TonB-dependent receptor-like protein
MILSGARPTTLGALLIAALLGRPAEARAQTPSAGTISGAILDAESGRPLPGARIDLTPPTGGRATVSDVAGRYAFGDIPSGAYQLLVRLIGYRPTTLDVDLPPMGELRLSVGLVVRPILLDPLPVTSPATTLGRGPGSDALARVDVERGRQIRYLASDVRGLTAADLVEAGPVGETDLLRALQRLPGVTTRDDFTAQLWTRGARWSDTRVYFDGLPLFNPVHAAGVISAVQPEAIGAAYFHPGVRSASLGEGAAAALELSSRPAVDTAWNGAAELSAISARASIARRFAGGRSGIMVAGRRSYVDLIARTLPYSFHDVAIRLDHSLGAPSFLEASGVWERDDVRGEVTDLLSRNRGHWGSGLGRLSLVTRVGAMSLRHSVGMSQFTVRLRLLPDTGPGRVDPPPSHEPLDNTLRYVAGGAELAPLAPGRLAWRVGYEIVRQSTTYTGGPPTPYARTAAIGSLYVGTDSIGTPPGGFRLAGSLAQVALWSEGRWTPIDRVAVQLGVRAEVGGNVRDAGGVRLAPRVMVRYQPLPGVLSITGGWGRSFQYLQTLAPTGPRIGPDLHLSDVWLLAGDSVPALRSDVVTAGAELWVARRWLAAINAYERRTSGVTEPDPTPGSLLVPRPPFVKAVHRARGLDVSLRRLVGPATLAISYSHVWSTAQAAGFRYHAATERRHTFDATAMIRAAPGLNLGGAVTAVSGSPFSRFFSFTPLPTPSCDSLVPGCLARGSVPELLEEPSGGRAPSHASVDLLADWAWSRPRWELGATLQLHNVFNWRNASTYVGSTRACTLPPGPDVKVPRPGVCDRFEHGLPLFPSLGVRVAF